jgi:hypothetical protein
VKRRRIKKTTAVARPRPVEKFWACTELGANKLGIECPHCEGKTVVNKKFWLVGIDRLFTTRGCTYCGWFASIPQELLPARDPRKNLT